MGTAQNAESRGSSIVSFSELVETQGGGDPKAIPNAVLYGWLSANQDNLVNEARLGVDRIPSSLLGKEVCRRAKQDLLFLSQYLLWETNPFSEGGDIPISESRITEASHGLICKEFFVRKDDSKRLLDQDPRVKTRIILWPRGGMKSTLDLCDAVQWILNFPPIRILFITAADDLAIKLLEEFKGHWALRPDNPTLLNLFFPAFCMEEKDMGNQFQFTCPVWAAKKVRRKEPTVMASSVTSTTAGLHFELLKADDVVSDRNSESEDVCRKTTKQFNLRKKTLIRGGYVDIVGTRYSDVDMHGTVIEQSSLGELIEKRGQNWSMYDNVALQTRVLVARAIEIKPERLVEMEKEGVEPTYAAAGENGCTLLLPEYMKYADICQQFNEDAQMCEGQLNQNPRPAVDVTFDRPLLLKNTVPPHDMPERGVITHTWDFAFSSKKGRDYSTASSVLWKPDGTMFVHDLIRQRYKPDDLAKAVVEFAKKWKPMIIGIEKAAGSELIHSAIMMHARSTGDPYVLNVCGRIDWFTPDNTKDAKKTRMGALHSWFVHDRLKIANYLPHLQVLYDEFERCLVNSGHNDIPDVISQQPQYAPQMQMAASDTPRDQQVVIDPQYNLLYGPYLTEDEMPADAFGRLGMGNPMQIIQEFLEPEPDFFAETPSKGMPGILGGGLWG